MIRTWQHPEPVPLHDTENTKLYVYDTCYLFPSRSALDRLLCGRYIVYTGRYPHGQTMAYGYTVAGALRRARRAVLRRNAAAKPVDVSHWTQP